MFNRLSLTAVVVALLAAGVLSFFCSPAWPGTPKAQEFPWNKEPCKEITKITGLISSLAFAPKEQILAYSTYEGHIGFWDLSKNKPLQADIAAPKDSALYRIDISACEKYLITASKGDGTSHLVLWDFSTKKKIWECNDFNHLNNARFFPEGTKIAATDFAELRIFEVNSNKPCMKQSIDPGFFSMIDFSANGKQIFVAGTAFGKFNIFEEERNLEKNTVSCRGHALYSIVALRARKQIVLGACNKPLLLYADGKTSEFSQQTRGCAHSLAVSPDNRWLGVCEKHRFFIWDLDKNKEEGLQVQEKVSFGVSFCASGRYFAVSKSSGQKQTSTILIWKKR